MAKMYPAIIVRRKFRGERPSICTAERNKKIKEHFILELFASAAALSASVPVELCVVFFVELVQEHFI